MIHCSVFYRSYATKHPACSRQLDAYAVLRRACPYLVLAAKPTKYCSTSTAQPQQQPTYTIIGAATSNGDPNRRQSVARCSNMFKWCSDCFTRALAFVCFTPSECQLAVGDLGLKRTKPRGRQASPWNFSSYLLMQPFFRDLGVLLRTSTNSALYMDVYMCVYMCIYIYIYICECVCVCVYVYIIVYIYIWILLALTSCS